jgi:tetratricopeptide (TPR) repeat protein
MTPRSLPPRLLRGPGLAALLAALALLTLPDAAQAQPRGPRARPTDPKTAEAKRLFDEGADLYAKGSYDKAIAAWEKSYELSSKPLIFESIANAYERLGQARKAREYLAKWRDVAPPDEHTLLDARLKNLDERVAREDAIEAARAAAEAKRRKEQEAREAQKKEDQSSASVPGLVLVGAGAGVIAVGVTFGVIASARRPDTSTACVPAGERQVCSESVRDGISSSTKLAAAGDVLWIVGAGAAAAGTTLILLKELKKPAATTGMIVPVVSPSGGGISIRYRF